MDIQSLLEEAKEQKEITDNVLPMAYIELTGDVLLTLALPDINDTQSIVAQSAYIARVAFDAVRAYLGTTPVALGFYAEAWRIRDTNIPFEHQMRPVESAKREEVLSISFWHHTQGITTCTLPVLRDHKKRIIGFGPEERGKHRSYQIEGLLQGTLDAQRPYEEVREGMLRDIQHKTKNFTPEQWEEIRVFLQKDGIVF